MNDKIESLYQLPDIDKYEIYYDFQLHFKLYAFNSKQYLSD